MRCCRTLKRSKDPLQRPSRAPFSRLRGRQAGSEGGRTVTTWDMTVAQNLREKIKYLATDDGPILVRLGTSAGEDGTPPLLACVLGNVGPGTSFGEDMLKSWQISPRQISLELQFALEQLTRLKTLIELLNDYLCDTFDEHTAQGGVPEITLDDKLIYTKVASSRRIASYFQKFIENQEEADALTLSPPIIAMAAGWLQKIRYATRLGLTYAYDENGDYIGNNFFTAEGANVFDRKGFDDDIRTYSGDDRAFRQRHPKNLRCLAKIRRKRVEMCAHLGDLL